MEYILYCDESSSDGPKYSDFFGGCIINSVDLKNVENALNAKKDELNLHGEIKWTKVTAQYLEKYIAMVDLFLISSVMGKSKSGLCSETMRIGHRIIMTGIATTTNISNYIINF